MIRLFTGYAIALGITQVLLHPQRRWKYGTSPRLKSDPNIPEREGTTMEAACAYRDEQAKKEDGW